MNIILRKATESDGEVLLKWRNDPEVYRYYHHPEPVEREQHFAWLAMVLASGDRSIYIAEEEGRSVGMLRFDKTDKGSSEVSWAVDPKEQRRGIGTAMLRAGRSMARGELVAEIKKDNLGSIKIAEAAGFTITEEKDGILHYHSGDSK